MSDEPNGRPPGQNNLDAGVERYVDPKNDPSANAVKPDSEQAKESGIVAQEETDPKVQAELDAASKNFVQPSSAEEKEEEDEHEELRPRNAPQQSPKQAPQPAAKK